MKKRQNLKQETRQNTSTEGAVAVSSGRLFQSEVVQKRKKKKEGKNNNKKQKTLSGTLLEILLEGWSCVWDRLVFLLASLEFVAKGERKRVREGETEREGERARERVRERVREREGEKDGEGEREDEGGGGERASEREKG